MLLKKIKLAGFKSFVDPTVILLPSHLVAVVGPNGCGKSNIIDAVCWVMGETSAKYLRGESLTDVIFNGSTARKPVGQASVELVFDNQDGSLGGEYASYAEISIRRVITREGDSGYFLNGTRCRRRDIVDIFLGTGLGPRSYSIIGQNMISRVIEARPEEMRVYLEEAAGVSKYKERRRETENRIQHTKENMARLDDIRLELDKQLASLKRQANAAEKFQSLKQTERLMRAQWFAIQWRELDSHLVQQTLQIQQQETGLEARQASLTEIDRNIEQKRNAQHHANQLFQEAQRRFYVIGNDITRIEQDIRYHQERRQQWQMDLDQAEKDWEDAKNQLGEIEDELHELNQDITQLEPESVHASENVTIEMNELTSAEEAMQLWQTCWDEFNQRTAKTTKTAEVEQTRIQHLEQRLVSLKQRQTQLAQEEQQFNFSQLENDLAAFSQQLSEVTALAETQEKTAAEIRQTLSDLHTSEQETHQQLDQVKNELQQLRGQQASLEALQQTALGQRNNRLVQWLTKHKLDQQPRLVQSVEVENGWENAVEKVLGSYLQAVCVDKIADVVNLIEDFKEGSLCVFSQGKKSSSAKNKAATLLSKVKSEWPLESLLSNIYAVDSQQEALALCDSLDAHESVITPEGVWLNANWLRVSHNENPEAGVFQRKQELKQLEKKISALELTQTELEKNLKNIQHQLETSEEERDALQKTMQQTHAQSAEIRAQQKTKQERLSELQARAERYRKEQNENTNQLKQTQEELTEARSIWQQAISEMEQHSNMRDTLTEQRDHLREKLQTARVKANEVKEEAHQLEIRLQTTKSQQGSLQQNSARMQTQLDVLTERKTTLLSESNQAAPSAELEKKLADALNERLGIEQELNIARDAVALIEQETHSFETNRQEVERELTKIRNTLESSRIECQSLKVKSENFISQLNETGFKLEEVLQDVPPTALASDWHSQLEEVAQRITRLGAINLVAIEEYATCSERKTYLDKQHEDLLEGLNTLESAIAKIDKETRARFKETFDKVNDRFQELFPKIFGGGRAYLELTGENLLDSGITVMACPPGKRNSTIHLLSGGEKALTAIALVFSIFHLNPAPFCLLDEVDAPLDDMNVTRYCQLVKTMAEKTQFIFISHNKLAIEMAEHLMGVTMHEPGVSRLVSVSIEEAISLATA